VRLKKALKKIGWILLIIFVVIQFFHPSKNISSANAKPVNHISSSYVFPPEVKNIMKISCLDCHSNNTYYPWYAKVQPVDWWLNGHIKDGKQELNFDEFSTYSLRRQFRKFKEMKRQVEEDEMPLPSYTLIHRDAILSFEQKQTLINWSERMMREMQEKYPEDSLVKKDR
jgi:hypothetical protein